MREKVEAKLDEAAETEAEVLSRRIQETKEQHYILNAAITKRATREMVLADQEGRPISTAFNNQQWGQGAAIGFILFAIIIALAFIQRLILRERTTVPRRKRFNPPASKGGTQ